MVAQRAAEPAPRSRAIRTGHDPYIAPGSAANPKLDAVMDQANKAYDRGDDEDAQTMRQGPREAGQDVRMSRIMVSSACFEGDSALAQEWYVQLPKPIGVDEAAPRPLRRRVDRAAQ